METPSFEAALDALRQDPSALPWQSRLELAKRTVAALASRSRVAPSVLPLFKFLATDPKWEVRKEVADHLHCLSDGEFVSVAAPLASDENAFVKKAAELALARRKRGEVSDQKRRRGLDRVQSDLRRLEQSHGEAAARMAEGIAQRLYEVLVGTTVHARHSHVAQIAHRNAPAFLRFPGHHGRDGGQRRAAHARHDRVHGTPPR